MERLVGQNGQYLPLCNLPENLNTFNAIGDFKDGLMYLKLAVIYEKPEDGFVEIGEENVN